MRPIRALVWNDLDSVSRVRAEYRCHGKAGLRGSGPSALLLAKSMSGAGRRRRRCSRGLAFRAEGAVGLGACRGSGQRSGRGAISRYVLLLDGEADRVAGLVRRHGGPTFSSC